MSQIFHTPSQINEEADSKGAKVSEMCPYLAAMFLLVPAAGSSAACISSSVTSLFTGGGGVSFGLSHLETRLRVTWILYYRIGIKVNSHWRKREANAKFSLMFSHFFFDLSRFRLRFCSVCMNPNFFNKYSGSSFESSTYFTVKRRNRPTKWRERMYLHRAKVKMLLNE